MDIKHFSIVLILICAVAIFESACTKHDDEKSLEKPTVSRDRNNNGAPNYDTAVTLPKGVNYKLSYADYEITWRHFKLEHEKSYTSASEEMRRFAIFMKNVKIIEAHNMKYHLGHSTYWMDINHFSDWTPEEFRAWIPPPSHAKSRSKRQAAMRYDGTGSEKVPDNIDWGQKGFNPNIDNKGLCGSCYAFSTTGSIEGQWFAQNGKRIYLSEQQILDCSSKIPYRNKGCEGGSASESFRYILLAGGLESDSTYPFTATDGRCSFDKSRVVATMEGYYVPTNEGAMKTAVGVFGPVAVDIYISDKFMSYKGGIFNDREGCENERMKPEENVRRHALLVMGYGTSNVSDYWILKNCWGKGWGDKGSIKMARNTGGSSICDIVSGAVFPAVPHHTDKPENNENNHALSLHRCLENNAITVLAALTFVLLKYTQ